MSGVAASPVSLSPPGSELSVTWCDSSNSISGVINKTIGAERPAHPASVRSVLGRVRWTIKQKQCSFQTAGNLSTFSLNYPAGLCTWYDPNFPSALQEDVPEQGAAAPGVPGALGKMNQPWVQHSLCCTFVSPRSQGCINCSDGFLKLVATSLA